ncbi:MAG: hypothetical protein LVQ96_04370 [Thermoplasmatales archaeon]|nr:hypothetical protein [Thermoplasmatales archaeon]MCW6170389.1 hypothetical protein [Thermoplasmatales archaeon]
MNRREKYFFVEGFYDGRFFRAIIDNIFKNLPAKIIQYFIKRDEKVDRYIISLDAQHISFLFIADEDPDHFSSKESRINELTRRFPRLPREKIVLIVPEIEGWYIAGLPSQKARSLEIRNLPDPDNCSKEKFVSILPRNTDGIPIRSEMLENYDLALAMSKSTSFQEFVNKAKQI